MKAVTHLPKGAAALLAAAALLTPGLSSGQTTNRPAGRPDFSVFKLVLDRNIFDPNRRGARSTTRVRESRRTSRVEYATLVGTMNYDEKGPLAFFEGTSSEYRKVLKPSDTIAGYKIGNVGNTSVKLLSATNEIVLPVGMQLRREDEGEWHVAEPSYSPSEPRTESVRSSRSQTPAITTQPGPAPFPGGEGEPPPPGMDSNLPPFTADVQNETGETNAPPEPPAAGGGDSVLQRLMQQRAEQLNR